MSVNVSQVDFTFVEGNDPTLSLTIKADGNPVDLTGATVEMYIKSDKNMADDDIDAVLLTSDGGSPPIVISDQTNPDNLGKVEISIGATDIDGKKPQWHHVDVIKLNKRQTYGYGNIYKINV